MSAVRTNLRHFDLWISDSLGGADAVDRIWLARLRGLALAGAALTLAMSAWKVIGPLTTADLFLVAAGLLLLPRFRLAEAKRLRIPALAVGLIAVGGLIGTTAGSDVTGSVDALGRLLAASLGAMVLVICWRPGPEQIRSFAWLWVAGGVISGLVALAIPDLHMFLRPSGLAPHPSHLAIISLILLGVGLGLVASGPTRRHSLAGLAACGVLFVAIVASGSRAGLLAAIVVIVLALVATRNRATIGIVGGAIALGLVATLLGIVDLGDDNALERLWRGDATSSSERETFNDAAWERFKAHPITGEGFAEALEPHNFFLQMGSAAGVLGIAGAVMLVLLALRTYVVAVWRRMAELPAHRAMVAGLTAAVIGYLAASVFQNIIWDRNVWMAIALMTWAAATSLGGEPEHREYDRGTADALPEVAPTS